MQHIPSERTSGTALDIGKARLGPCEREIPVET